ncbi:MAG: anti-CBASS protein Acb1 family protein, partial [Vulcanimicrobiaceae bacterium]
FNVLDPLNTSGSLVMNQDPNSPDFLKPSGEIHVNGKPWHPSRLFVKMHEQPLYIEWSPSAFGFVGRSVYQRPLYALKTFLQSMITDQMVTRKAGLLVAKMESPGSAIDNVMQAFFGLKRSKIKEGVTNEVLQVGIEESIETLNMQNLDKAASFARTNVLKNVATACGMPASLIAQETLTEGFGEGTEDAKKEAGYLDYVRLDMQPSYDFVDRIVMRKAWTQEFYETLFPDYPEYKTKPFHTSLHEWMRAFSATWPNLLVEPDSEKAKTQDVKMKAVIAMVEVLSPELDAQSEASLLAWAAENANEAKELFSGKLDIDTDALLEHLQAKSVQPQSGVGEEEEKEPEPRPFTIAS